MRIESCSVDMSSKRTYSEEHVEEESLKMWRGNNRTDLKKQNLQANQTQYYNSNIVEISEQGKRMLKKLGESDSIEYEISDKDKLKIKLIEKFVESLTGRKIKIHTADKIKLKANDVGLDIDARQGNRYGWGLEYDFHQSYQEKETMMFKSEGIIKTSDGRKLNFSIDLSMKREFMSQKDIFVRAGDAPIDPLVVNFGNTAADLTDNKISFDLDFDGQKEEISFASEGSGFLALDLNNDGIINNGKELFGPKTGDGFSELGQYDDDGNNWIDEGDSIFDKLKIWVKDEDGNDALFTLNQKGIGALYINSIDTSFSIKDNENKLKGEVQKTGIFIREDGTTGTLQHIDISI